jgi:hypothetical protein
MHACSCCYESVLADTQCEESIIIAQNKSEGVTEIPILVFLMYLSIFTTFIFFHL